jgi:hypothetical protein
LFKWLGRQFGSRSAVESRQENPVLLATVRAAAAAYDEIPLRDYIDAETSERMARDFYLDINSLCNARSPKVAGREKLVQAVLRNALYQVLLIPPSPAPDDSGLREMAGISGELTGKVEELAIRNMALRAGIHESPLYRDDVDLNQLIQAEYWTSLWHLRTYDAARRELGDAPAENDWLQPFIHGACANQENLYRIDVEMPSAFDESIAREAPTAYSIFTDIVISGAPDPLAEWLDYHKGTLVPIPGGIDPDAATSIQQASNSQ